MTGLANKDKLIGKLIEDIRQNRCRSLSEEDVTSLLDEVSEEMVGGRNMFKFLVDETLADAGKESDKWEDLK
jgi:hypothetical protein